MSRLVALPPRLLGMFWIACEQALILLRFTFRTWLEPSELLAESLEDRSHRVAGGSIGQLTRIDALVV